MEENLPFWEMEPADALSSGGATIPVGIGGGRTVPLGPQVFAKQGEVYAVYLPTCEATGTLDLTALQGTAELRWFNPRVGAFVGEVVHLAGGKPQPLGPPPVDSTADWVVLVRKRERPARGESLQTEIDTSAFRSGTHHWRRIRDENRVIQPLPNQPQYSPAQVAPIVENILLFQRDNGGWPKDYDMLAVLAPEQVAAIHATRGRDDTSFDNGNIHSQVDYLARAYTLCGVETWRDACLRGFDFMLAAQLENGGFPQRYPRMSGYAAHITFNDGVMTGILNVLRDAADGAGHWRWLDSARRQKAQLAVARGIDCILMCQIRAAGVRTGWCQQHDGKTFQATSARTFELASCCPQETTAIVRLLMRVDSPTTELQSAIEDAVAWLGRTELRGIRVERTPALRQTFDRHEADFDVVVVSDDDAPVIWARHYEIGTDRPIFAGRDGVKRFALADIERERRTGTAWYGDWPRPLLESEYPAWRGRRTVQGTTQE